MKSSNTWITTFLILFLVCLFLAPVFAQEDISEGEPTDFGILSLLPPLLAITLAFITREVILSLFLGIFIGATMMSGWNPFLGYLRTLDQYILGSLADSWNAGILFFTLTIGGMVGIMTKMGGAQAVADYLANRARTAKGGQIVTWLLGLFVFFDDYANTLVLGPTMRPLTDRLRVSREKLSYIIDSTTAPVAGLALMSTWIGYEIGLIKDVYETMTGGPINAYAIFLSTLPYRFYEIFTLIMVFLIAYMGRDYGPMYDAEIRARKTGKLNADGARAMSAADLINIELPEGTKPKIMNAVIPVVSLVILGFIGLWYSGGGPDLPFTIEGIRDAFGDSDTSVALVWASVTASGITILLAISQKILDHISSMEAWVDGAKSLINACIILTLAWSIGSVTEDVQAAEYLIKVLVGAIPAFILPSLVFIISMIISFATGTSWGTMAIVIPLALPLAKAIDPNVLLPTLGAVLAGAIFGDHCSPISDTTILSSMAAAGDLMDHVKTQLPYAITAALVSLIIGYIPAGLGLSPIVLLPLGIIAIYLIIKFIGKPTDVAEIDLIDTKQTGA